MKAPTVTNAKATVVVVCGIALIAAALVGFSYARYVTEGPVGDATAQVAKWGVEISADNTGAFQTTYKNDGTTIAESINDSIDIVAPGTSGTLVDYSVTGTPEVLTEISFNNFLVTLDNWTVEKDGASTFYCPLVFSITTPATTTSTAQTTTIRGTDYDSATSLEAALTKAIDSATTYIEPGSTINTTTSLPSFSWEWPFTEDGTDGQTNALDTALGNAAAAGTTIPTISLTGEITAQQVLTKEPTAATTA